MNKNYASFIVDTINRLASKMDMIFLGSGTITGTVIRYAQIGQTYDGPSLWSDVCLYVDDHTVIESTMDFSPFNNSSRWTNGIQYCSLEKRIKYSAYNCDLIRWDIRKSTREKIFNEAKFLLSQNVTYNIWGTISSLLVRLILSRWAIDSSYIEKEHIFSSEFVAKCYESAGFKFRNHETEHISPQLLYDAITDRYKNKIDIMRISRNGRLAYSYI